jgi:nitrous oxide reductase accessory protein NosL
MACGVQPDADGSLPDTKKFRQHMPTIVDRINVLGHLIPDGPKAQIYLAKIPKRVLFSDWKVDHRYFKQSALPLASLPAWLGAAKEMNEMLDQAKIDGVI